VVGHAKDKDLAVLKIEAPKEKLPAISKGKSYNLQVGQNVLAIGNPFGLDQTLTTGIISALGREIKSRSNFPIRDVIQTDAAINPGNSGGPLLDSRGNLIGVNTAIYSTSGSYAGIGFSIPVDVVKAVVPDLIEFGEVHRPTLGVQLTPRPIEGIKGAIVLEVIKGSAAEKAGLKSAKRNWSGEPTFDIITGIDDIPVNSYYDLVLALEKYEPGDLIKVKILRGKNQKVFDLVLDPDN
jgi:S1-C subfamily serine protease